MRRTWLWARFRDEPWNLVEMHNGEPHRAFHPDLPEPRRVFRDSFSQWSTNALPPHEQGTEDMLLDSITSLMKSASAAARDVCRNRDAFVSVEFTGVGETVEVAWHVGVRRRRTIGQSKHEYDTTDLWGTGGSLEDALKDAQQAMNPRGGRRK